MSYTCLPQPLLPSQHPTRSTFFFSDITMTSILFCPASAFRGRPVRDVDNLHKPLNNIEGRGRETNMVEMRCKAGKRHLVFNGNLDM